MEIFVHRAPKGFYTLDLEDINELAELLTNYGPLEDNSEVTLEITAPWATVKELLSQPIFAEAWFKPGQK